MFQVMCLGSASAETSASVEYLGPTGADLGFVEGGLQCLQIYIPLW